MKALSHFTAIAVLFLLSARVLFAVDPPTPPVLTTIAVTPLDATVPVGANIPFKALALDQNKVPMNPQPAIAFAVTDGGGTFDANNVFTAVKAGGPYTVTATSGAVVGRSRVTIVTPAATPVLTSIVVIPGEVLIKINTTFKFSVAARDQAGLLIVPQPAITWSVSGGGTIDPTGLFTATTAGGPFTVTAKSGNISGTAKVGVDAGTPPPPPAVPVLTSIVVKPEIASVHVGEQLLFKAFGLDQNGGQLATQPAMVWSVDGGGTVDTTGLFSATTVGGPFTVTAKSGNFAGVAKIKVEAAVTPPATQVLTRIVVNPENVTVHVNDQIPYKAVGLDQNGGVMATQPTIVWAVDGGGTIEASGLFKATTVGGPFTVTAKSGNITGTAKVKIETGTPPPPVDQVLTSIVVKPDQALIHVGEQLLFKAFALDQKGFLMATQPAMTWAVDGGGTIDANGLFSATTVGSLFTVTAKSGTISGSAKIKVEAALPPPIPPVDQVLTSIVVRPGEAEIHLNDMLIFKAFGLDQNGGFMATQPTVVWTVDGGGTIDPAGLFKASAVGGPFNVTATSGAVSGKAKLKVEDAGVPPNPVQPPAANPVLTSVVVFPREAKVPVNAQLSFFAVGRDQNGAPMPTQPAFTWTASAGGTIDANGIFTATTVGGPYTVTATAGTLSGTATVSVVSATPPPAATNPVLTSISVFPREIDIPVNVKLAFIAVARDQNGAPLATQPAITWSSIPAGSVDATGVFKSSVGGEFKVIATSGAVSGGAEIRVFNPRPPVAANQVFTSIEVFPKDAKVALNGTVKFNAKCLDQNKMPMVLQPAVTWSVSAGGTIDANGVFKGTTTGGAYTVTATSGAISATGSVTVLGELTIVSGPIALPDPAFVGDKVHLCVFALGSGPLSAVWDYGDATSETGKGLNVDHVYAAAGKYTAKVTVSDTVGHSVSATVDVVIISAGTPVTGANTLSNVALFAKLNFEKANNDTLNLLGTLSDLNTTTLAGVVVSVNVGGVTQAFTLDANGSATLPNGSFILNATTKQFAAKITGGSFASSWTDEGIDPAVNVPSGSTVFPVTVKVDGVDYAGAALVRYSSKVGKGAVIRPTAPGKRKK